MVTTQQLKLWGVLMLLGAVGILSLLLTDLPLPAAVREEVSQIAGVTNIEVDAKTGHLSVTSDAPLDDAAVIAAVDAAGYAAERA